MSLEDVKIEVDVSSELVGASLHIKTTVADQVFHKVAFLEEQAVKEALIELGWTPPKEVYE